MAAPERSTRLLTVFVAAPQDVTAERQRLADVVSEMTLAKSLGITLQLRDFRQVVPGMGRPQAVINQQLPVGEWDFFVGILWHRFGLPTGAVDPATNREPTGTEEEFRIAYEYWRRHGRPRILLYRCTRKPNLREIDGQQITKVNEFFADFDPSGEHPGLYKPFTTTLDFERKIRSDLETLLLDYDRVVSGPPAAAATAATAAVDTEAATEAAEPGPHTLRVLGKEFVFIPPGPFTLGTEQSRIEELNRLRKSDEFSPEHPAHTLHLPGYYISRYPVTYAEYAVFVKETGRPVPYKDDPWSAAYSWDRSARTYPTSRADHPVVLVTWQDAADFCRWFGGRLPTEPEWEKAARGQNGREWPWGDTWLAGCCNSAEAELRQTSPIAQFSPQGDSPFGVGDMAGNVWEWCSSLFRPYPYRADDGREEPTASGRRILRGGALDLPSLKVRGAARHAVWPDEAGYSIGFRVVLPHPLSGRR